MNYFKLPIYALAAALITAPTVANAWWWDDDDDDEEIPFDEGRLFFELNDTDGDLGIHGKIDGDEWKYLEIEDPRERKMLNIWVRGRLRKQGLTELFFESAEPCFPDTCEDGDEPLAPETFFKRFPEGVYEIEGKTLDGEERENEVYLSHVIPAAPVVDVNGTTVNGGEPLEDCVPEVTRPVVLSWPAVTEAHPDLGKAPGSDLEDDHGLSVIYYEVVVEIDETDYKTTSIVPADITSWMLPEDFFNQIDGDEYKFEVLVRIDNGNDIPGNKTAMEGCFELAGAD